MEKYCPTCFKKYPPETERCPQDGSYLVSPEDRDLAGQELDDRYTVLERIGRGGMGVVYKAEQKIIKRVVALKVLRREVVQDESAVKRFLTEAKAIASLTSRHTVTLYDFGVTRDGLLFYTMELLKGQPLTRLIKQHGPLDPYRAVRFVLQVCDSLEEAHEHGILHRDLKPDNLFVVARRGKDEITVLDFGIAKLVGDASVESVTRTGMIVGTPQYLSPEQALGNPVVPASDLYSLGIVLYEMLAGSPPFQDETPMKTMWAHIRDPVPPLNRKNPAVQVPRSIELFLQKVLEKEPGKRFQSVPAFRDALRRAVEQHDAAPETVGLPPLSTSSDGLRLKPDGWGAEQTIAAEPDGVLQPEEQRVPPGPATAPLVGGLPDPLRGEPATANTSEPATESGEQAAPLDPMDTGMAAVWPRHRTILPWIAAAVLAVSLVAVLGIWRPWIGNAPAPQEEAGPSSLPVADAPESQSGQADHGGNQPTEWTADRLAEEASRRKAEEDAARLAAQEAARRKADAEAANKAAQESTRRQAEEEAKRAEEEATRKAAEAAAAKKAEEEAAKFAAGQEQARKEAEEEASKKAAEEEARKKAEGEAARLAAAQEAARKKADEEAARKTAEDAARMKAKEDAARRKAAEDAAKLASEQTSKKKAAEDAARKKAEDTARLAAEQAAKKKAAEDAAKAAAEKAKKKAAEKAKTDAAKPADGDFEGLKIQ